MLRLLRQGGRLCDGITRREWLRIGGVGLGGLTLPALLRGRARAAPSGGRAKSAIVLFHGGGLPQHETWDPKPEGPAPIRGEFGAIPTRTPGLRACELMPRLAALSDRLAVVRSIVTGDNSHSSSGYQMLTGMPHIPLSRENAKPGRPNDHPSLNALVQALRPARGGLPPSVSLPRRLANNGGQDPWPGTDAGLLGRRWDPWFVDCDPASPDFSSPVDSLPAELPPLRLSQRVSLRDQLNSHFDRLRASADVEQYGRDQLQALDLLAGGRARSAFELSAEPASLRDRYGRTAQGQSVLLARRLVEAGVSLVQVNWANLDKGKPNSGGWDTHEQHAASLKGWLMPVFDQVVSALIEDLEGRGLLDETLVCVVAEFGHTPKINAKGGRDHWGRVFSIALAGGGIQGGLVLGETDEQGGEPLDTVVRPADYLATVLHCLGYAPETVVHDPESRPLPISRGRVLTELLAGV